MDLNKGSITHCVQASTIATTLTFPAASSNIANLPKLPGVKFSVSKLCFESRRFHSSIRLISHMLRVIFAQLNKYVRSISFSGRNHTFTESKIPAGEVDKMESPSYPLTFLAAGVVEEITNGAHFNAAAALRGFPRNPISQIPKPLKVFRKRGLNTRHIK